MELNPVKTLLAAFALAALAPLAAIANEDTAVSESDTPPAAEAAAAEVTETDAAEDEAAAEAKPAVAGDEEAASVETTPAN